MKILVVDNPFTLFVLGLFVLELLGVLGDFALLGALGLLVVAISTRVGEAEGEDVGCLVGAFEGDALGEDVG